MVLTKDELITSLRTKYAFCSWLRRLTRPSLATDSSTIALNDAVRLATVVLVRTVSGPISLDAIVQKRT